MQTQLDQNIAPRLCKRALTQRTLDGAPCNGIGILQRLEDEIRDRAHNIWLETGNTDAEANWIAAEKDILVLVHEAEKKLVRDLERNAGEEKDKPEVSVEAELLQIREAELAKLQEELDSLNRQRDEEAVQSQKQGERIKELESTLEAQSASLTEIEETYTCTLKDKDEKDVALRRALEEVKKQQDELDCLNQLQENQAVQRQMQSESFEGLKSTLEARLSEMQEAYTCMVKEKDEKASALRRASEEVTKQQEELNLLNRQRGEEAVQRQNQSARVQQLESALEARSASLAEMVETYKGTLKEKDERDFALQKALQEVKQQQEELDHLNRQRGEEAVQRQRLSESVQELESTLDSRSASLAEMQEAFKGMLNEKDEKASALRRASEEVAKQQQELESSNRQRDEEAVQRQKQSELVKELESSLEAQSARLTQMEEAFKRKLKEKDEKEAASRKAVEDIKHMVQLLTTQLDEKNKGMRCLVDENNAKCKQIAMLEQQIIEQCPETRITDRGCGA